MTWKKCVKYSSYEDFKAGTLLKFKDGEILLVGDVNRNLGLCDCCVDDYPKYYSNDLVDKIKALMK